MSHIPEITVRFHSYMWCSDIS